MWNPLSKIPLAAQPKVVSYENNDSPASEAVKPSDDSDFFDGDFVVIDGAEVADVGTDSADVNPSPSHTATTTTTTISPMPQHTSTITMPKSPNRTAGWGKVVAAPDAGRDEAEFPSLATSLAISAATKKRDVSKLHAPPSSSPPPSAADHLAATMESGIPVEVVGPAKKPAPVASTEAHKGFSSKVAEGAMLYNSRRSDASGPKGGSVSERFIVPVPKLALGDDTRAATADTKSFNVDFSWNGHKDWSPRQSRRSKNTHVNVDKGRKQARAQKAAGW